MQISDACLFNFTAAATEPPAESWQNSYKPSKTGQSSPTLTVKQKIRNKIIVIIWISLEKIFTYSNLLIQ